MDRKERKEWIELLKEQDLDKTASFTDLMTHNMKKQHKKEKKKQEKELLEREKQESKKKKKKQAIKQKVVPPIEKEVGPDTTKRSLGTSLLLTIVIICGFALLIYHVYYYQEQVNSVYLIVQSSILLATVLALVKSITGVHAIKWSAVAISLLFLLIGFQGAVSLQLIALPMNDTVPDFSGKNIADAIKWAEKNNISYFQVYEYSDRIEEYGIVAQSVSAGTLSNTVEDIEFVVSNGPNYEKEVILTDMTGWDIDDALKVIEENFLNNVMIDFEINEEVKKDVVISQSISGQIKRNTEIKFVVSLGTEAELVPVEAIDLTGQSEFQATFWLKKNAILYHIEYELSDTVKKGYVISQDVSVGRTLQPRADIVTIVISKGKKITVPNLSSMKVDEVITWIIENNLKIEFEERFDATVPQGSIIEANYQQGDQIEEGTVIKIITSKGSLKLPRFSSVPDFRTWARKYNVNIREEYEFNDTVAQGDIIRLSHEENAIINYNDTVVIYISDGKAITVPNFYGKTKSTISSTCQNLGLNCTFYYSNSTATKDTAISQNKASGSQVVGGTYVNIALSNGQSSDNSSGSGGTSPSPTCTSITTHTLYIQDSWIGTSASATISNLTTKLSAKYPNITFQYITRDGNDPSGFIHIDSAITSGSTVQDCNTYTIIVNN